MPSAHHRLFFPLTVADSLEIRRFWPPGHTDVCSYVCSACFMFRSEHVKKKYKEDLKMNKQINWKKKQTEQKCTIVKGTNVLTAEVGCVTEVYWNSATRLKSILLTCVLIQVRATQFYEGYPLATSPAWSNISNWQEINWPTTWPIYTHIHTRMHTHTLLLIANLKTKRVAWG